MFDLGVGMVRTLIGNSGYMTGYRMVFTGLVVCVIVYANCFEVIMDTILGAVMAGALGA